MKKTLLSLSFIFAVFAPLMAQDGSNVQARKDSLRHVISTLEGAEKIAAYRQLGFIYFGEAKDEATMDSLLAVYKEMDAEAEKNNDALAQCQVRGNIIGAYINNNMLDKVIELSPGYLSFIEKKEKWAIFYSDVYRSYALAWLRKDNTEKALQIAGEMYEHADARGNDEGKTAAYYIMGLSYERVKRLDDAESYFRKAIDLLKNKEKLPSILSTYYFRLCDVLYNQDRIEDALQAARDCELVVETLQKQTTQKLPPTFWGNVWHLYAKLYTRMDDLEKAEHYIDKMDSLGFGTLVFKKSIYQRRTTIYVQRGEYEKALEYCILACETFPVYTDYKSGSMMWQKAEILSYLGRTEEAMKCIHEAVSKNDSIRNLDFNRQLDELRVIHEVDALTAEKERSRRLLIYAFIGCALLFVALAVWIYYSRRLQMKNINLAKQVIEQKRLYDESKARQLEILRLRQNEKPDSDSDADGKNSTNELRLFEQLERYMDEQRPFTNPLLNRKMLADALNTNGSYLRDCILNIAATTVNDYITLHRLNLANQLLMQSEQVYTIGYIAKESGFGSRSRFYECYRLAYGLTPAEFRKTTRK